MKELDDFTVERLQELANTPEKYDHRYICGMLTASESRALARIALAAKTAEPVAYADPQAFKNFHNEVATKEWMWANPEARLISMYAAPPLNSPAIPDGCQWTYDEHDYKWDSACGDAWQFTDGGPEDNHVKFCQGCGKPVLLPPTTEK